MNGDYLTVRQPALWPPHATHGVNSYFAIYGKVPERLLRPQARFGGPLDGQRPSVCKANPLVQLQNPQGFALLAITFS